MNSFNILKQYSQYTNDFKQEHKLFVKDSIHNWPFYTPVKAGFLNELKENDTANISYYLVRDGVLGILKYFDSTEELHHLQLNLVTHFDIYKCLPRRIRDCFSFYHFSFQSGDNDLINKDNIEQSILTTDVYSHRDSLEEIDRKIKLINTLPEGSYIYVNLVENELGTNHINSRNTLLEKLFKGTTRYSFIDENYFWDMKSLPNTKFILDINRLLIGYSYLESYVIGNYSSFLQSEIPDFESLTPIMSFSFSPYTKMNLYSSENEYVNTDFYQDTQFLRAYSNLIKTNRMYETYFLLKRFLP